MRISDWSSDVCSSDLRPGKPGGIPCGAGSAPGIWQVCRQCMADAFDLGISFVEPAQVLVDRLVAEKRIQPFENCQGNRNLFRREINLRFRVGFDVDDDAVDRKSTRLNSSH